MVSSSKSEFASVDRRRANAFAEATKAIMLDELQKLDRPVAVTVVVYADEWLDGNNAVCIDSERFSCATS